MPQTSYNASVGVKYAHISTTTATPVKTTAGYLEGVVINTAAAGTITLADGAATIGALNVASTYPAPGGITIGANFTSGLTVTCSVAMDITVLYR